MLAAKWHAKQGKDRETSTHISGNKQRDKTGLTRIENVRLNFFIILNVALIMHTVEKVFTY